MEPCGFECHPNGREQGKFENPWNAYIDKFSQEDHGSVGRVMFPDGTYHHWNHPQYCCDVPPKEQKVKIEKPSTESLF